LLNLLSKSRVVALELAVLHGSIDVDLHLGKLQGLDHVVKRAPLHRFDGSFDTAEGGHENNGDLWPEISEFRGELHTIDLRHFDIRDDNVDVALGFILSK